MAKKKDFDPDKLDSRGQRIGQRGARRGKTVVDGLSVGADGGSIGNRAYEPTDRDRDYVKSKIWFLTQKEVAENLGISRTTLNKYYPKELKANKTEIKVAITKKLVDKAVKGNVSAIKFILERRCGWNNKLEHEHSGLDGENIRIDLSPLIEGKTKEQLIELRGFFEQLLSSATRSTADSAEVRDPGFDGIDHGDGS